MGYRPVPRCKICGERNAVDVIGDTFSKYNNDKYNGFKPIKCNCEKSKLSKFIDNLFDKLLR